jgi:hypothetical protein
LSYLFGGPNQREVIEKEGKEMMQVPRDERGALCSGSIAGENKKDGKTVGLQRGCGMKKIVKVDIPLEVRDRLDKLSCKLQYMADTALNRDLTEPGLNGGSWILQEIADELEAMSDGIVVYEGPDSEKTPDDELEEKRIGETKR